MSGEVKTIPLGLTTLEAPRSVYAAFEVFPRPKGASTHIAGVVQTLARHHRPVWLLCCGAGDLPSFQQEGSLVIWRDAGVHANMLHRAHGFARFVAARLQPLRHHPLLGVFRDPWGGWPLLHTLRNAATVFEVNGLPSWELPYRYPIFSLNPPLREKIQDLERWCLSAADAVFTVSDVTRDALVQGGMAAHKVTTVPNCAADVFFEAPSEGAELASDSFDLPGRLSAGRWFGYIGSLHPWQGVELLVDAWAEIAGEWPDVQLLIVSGRRTLAVRQLRRRIRKRGLTGRVLLHPALSPERLAAILPRLEFTCAPLLETARNVVQGCCPIKIVESMAAGTPVLASDLRVNRALIRHDVDGLLVRPGDLRDWALALRRLLKDRGMRRRLGREALRTARARFTHRIMSDRLRTVFQSAFAGSRMIDKPRNPIEGDLWDSSPGVVP